MQNIGWFDTTASGELASRLNRYFVSFHCTVINASVSILVMLIQFTKVLDRGLPVQWISSFRSSLQFTTKEQKAYAQLAALQKRSSLQ